MVNKVFITGPVGGGKSTLANRLAREYGLFYCGLDGVAHEPDTNSPTGNRRRPEEDRIRILNELLSHDKWVLEDTGRRMFETVWREADAIILLEPPVCVRVYRILKRWVKQMLRLEKCGYKPGLWILKPMFQWTHDYESGKDSLKERLAPYRQKTTVIRSERDILQFITNTMRPS